MIQHRASPRSALPQPNGYDDDDDAEQHEFDVSDAFVDRLMPTVRDSLRESVDTEVSVT